MYVLYVTGENGKEVIGRYASLADALAAALESGTDSKGKETA